jgi:hypothetical protein
MDPAHERQKEHHGVIGCAFGPSIAVLSVERPLGDIALRQHPAPCVFPRTRILCLLAVVLGVGLSWALPALLARADAYATIAPGPVVGSSGLPDGRVYEQVSPVQKNGNYVASGGLPAVEHDGYAAAAADGNALLFLGSGAMGHAVSGVLGPYVARRSATGWSTESALPAQLGVVTAFGDAQDLVPSVDFSRFVFGSGPLYSPEQPLGPARSVNLYLTEDPFVAPAWLGKPTTANPIPKPGENTGEHNIVIAGQSPSLSTVYFSFSGTLTPEDSSRAANVGDGTGSKHTDPWGFYEWSEGTLRSAGVLPDGTLSPFGAVPAAMAGESHNTSLGEAAGFANEVSADGSRAFFVSPDPVASQVTDPSGCEAEGPCSSSPPELYERVTAPSGAKSTVLVSRSDLPGHEGEPAPDGPVSVPSATIVIGGAVDEGDVYASADGSIAFFASTDRLTASAPEDTTAKEYRFDLATQTVEYLPGVVGPIVAAAHDGSDFLFENTATTPDQLDLWRAGPEGGQVTPVAPLPAVEDIGAPYEGNLGVEARASTDGSVFMFDTNAPIPGFQNNTAGFGQVYRYDAGTDSLTCVSCQPAGVAATGNAYISYDNRGAVSNDSPRSTVDSRAMSADGGRIFFDSPDPLVPRASNGRRNVYEWERDGEGTCASADGCLYLISSGTSSEDSFFLDNSESGDDVFFNTSSGLNPADTDEAYDAYDARVPHPGDQTPPSAPPPCEASGCAPFAPEPELFGAPASSTITTDGNLVTRVASKPKSKPKPKPKPCKKRRKHRCRRASAHRSTTKRRGR